MSAFSFASACASASDRAFWIAAYARVSWQVHQGKELSYTNLLDLDAALRIALEFTEPAGVVIKHTNPCGVATGAAIDEAYVRARDADAKSAFGGIVGLNRPVDVATARALTATFIEAVIAPAVDPEALAVLAGRQNMSGPTPVNGSSLMIRKPDRIIAILSRFDSRLASVAAVSCRRCFTRKDE